MRNKVEKGDLLKTNPMNGYWVCSVVLSACDSTKDFDAMSHIAVTNGVFKHDFNASEITINKLRIIEVTNHEDKTVPCIGIYTSKLTTEVEVIGRIEVESFCQLSLKFEVGNGSDGGWPLCGPLRNSLGYQAIHQWRAIHDREKWLNDIKKAEKSHQEMIERLKSKKNT